MTRRSRAITFAALMSARLRRAWKRTRHLLVAGAVVALGLAISPATAGAASITVTPSTGIDYVHDVQVTGTGWEYQGGYEWPVAIYQCMEGRRPFDGRGGCGDQIGGAHPDAGGRISVTVRVESPVSYRVIVPGTPPPFNCADAAPAPYAPQYANCELRACQPCQAFPDELTAAAPIRFARPPATPCIGCADTTDPEDTTPVASALGVFPFGFPAADRGSSIAARRAGATVRYRLSGPATTRFTVQAERPGRRAGRRCVPPTRANRNRTRCRRYVTAPGGFSRRGNQGQNSFGFTGRLRGRKLPVGFYRLAAVPTNGTNDGRARFARFRIIP